MTKNNFDFSGACLSTINVSVVNVQVLDTSVGPLTSDDFSVFWNISLDKPPSEKTNCVLQIKEFKP